MNWFSVLLSMTALHFWHYSWLSVYIWYMVSSCVSPFVYTSVTSWCGIETIGRIELVLAWALPSIYPTLYYNEIWVSPKIRIIFSVTLCQALDLKNFATESWLVDASWLVSYTSNSIASICCGFVVQLVPTVMQQLTTFRLTWRVARPVCGSRDSCFHWSETVVDWSFEVWSRNACYCLFRCIAVHRIRCGRLVGLPVFVICLSVWSHCWALQKQLNQSRCRFGCGLWDMWTMWALFPYGKGHFWRSYNLGIAYLTLTLLASWQQRCVHSLRSNLIDVAFDQLHACRRQWCIAYFSPGDSSNLGSI